MRALPGPEFETSTVERFLSRWVRRSGLLGQRRLESLRVSAVVWRPFRRVRWECSTAKSVEAQPRYSLIDEQLASIVKVFDERLLLWRPRYAGIEPIGESREEPTPVAHNALKDVVEELLQHRATAQNSLVHTGPDLHRLQADSLSPLGLVFPRYPFRGKRESALLEQHQSAAGTLLATSLVTNCASDLTIQAAVLEERVCVGTLIGEYRDLRTHATRLLALETPGASSLKAALNAGQALTRLCELNRACAKLLASSVGLIARPNR